MKHPRLRRLIDQPDDIAVELALISLCCLIGFGALIYLVVV